jgi:hypothetical protein
VTAPAAAAIGRWTSIACTLGAGFLRLWIDGRAVGEMPAADLPSNRGQGVSIGFNDPDGDHFHGALDNVLLWRGVQPAAQICDAAPACRRP